MPKQTRAALPDLTLLQREMNQLFERLSELERGSPGDWSPPLDVYECSGSLIVVLEVPGLSVDAIKVVCKDRALSVSGERRARRPLERDARFLCVERPSGRFNRTIPLDAAVDASAAEARLAGGVLTITLPRVKDRRGRGRLVPVTREGK